MSCEEKNENENENEKFKKNQAKFLTMMVVSHEIKGLFFHVHKSGGSYIETILRLFYNFKELNLPFTPLIVNDSVKEYGLFGINLYNNPILSYLNNYFKFTMVRNPYSRAISGYKFLKNYMNYTMPKELSDLSFTEFFIESNKSRKYSDNFIYTHILLSQTDTICDYEGDMNFDYVAKYENFVSEIDFILNKLNVPDRTRHFKLIEKNIRINTDEMKKKKTEEHEIYYTRESLNIVNKIFKNDFINFDYKMITNIEEMPGYLEDLKNEEKNNERIALDKLGITKTDLELDKSKFLSSLSLENL